MWVFARNFPADSFLLAPRAPHSASQGGYSWRAPAVREGWPTVDLLRPSAAALIDLLEAFSRAYGLEADPVDVIGFSQGAALTFTLGMLYPQRIRRLAILSGFAPVGSEEILGPAQLTGKNVFVTHGTFDEIVPIDQAVRTIQLLEGAGASVTYCEGAVGHKVSAECLSALETYLRS